MHINIDTIGNRCEIWIPFEEKGSYKQNQIYQDAINKYKSTHQINVFVGGQKPVLDTVAELMGRQMI